MKVEKKDLEKSQVELNIELSLDEFKPYIEKGVKEVSKGMKIDGFRDGNAPADMVMKKAGEMNVLDHSARIAINKTLESAVKENLKKQVIGNPKVDVTMLAPGSPLKYKVIFAYLPDVKLGEYKGNKIKAEKLDVKDSDVNKTIEALKEQMITETLVDRKCSDNDKVVLDIEMFVDNVPMEGGQSKGTSVLLGKEYLVKGFDKNIIGAKKGDELNFTIKFPEKHHDTKFANKDVEFKIKVNDVYERKLPEMDESFFKKFGVSDEKALKNVIMVDMKAEKGREAEQKTDSKIIEKIVKISEVDELPDLLINEETKKMMSEIEQDITGKGGKLEDYLSSLKKSREEFEKDLLPSAISRVRSALVMREIGIKEKIDASEKEIDDKVAELLKQYKGYQKVEDRINEPGYRTYLHNILVNNKIMQSLRDWNIDKEEVVSDKEKSKS